MNIGVIGSGIVGQVLAKGFREAGHNVMIGTRDAAKLKAYSVESGVAVGTFTETALHGEAIIFAVLGTAVAEVIKGSGPANFKGKLVLDTTNPLDFSKGFPPSLFVGHTDSLAEQIQRALPEAFVVKAFNTMSNTRMIKPKFADGTPTHLIAGNDAAAKKRAGELLEEVGWKDVVDLGPLAASRELESLCLAWCRIYGATGSGEHAFALLRN
jgi:predicted dinucleotide-binding enzyme